MLQSLTGLVQWLRWGLALADAYIKIVPKMEFKSGDFEGHGNTLMLFWVRKSLLYKVGHCPAETMWQQNIVSITLSRQISLDTNYVCSVDVGHSCQHHDASTAKSFNLLYVDNGKRSLRRPYTRVRPSHLWMRKQSWSLNQIRRNFLKVQTLNVWHQRTRARLCTAVKTDLT